jgi:hypothetical protein
MPLGKVKQDQIREAYKVLCQLLELVNGENPDRNQISLSSNNFYSLIPHSTATNLLPLLDNKEIIKVL